MTSQRHCFHTFVACRVPVRIANGLVIYSEGKGTVLFIPRGANGPTVHISDVLFMPELGCNLFSPLHLTQHKDFKMVVNRGKIQFIRQGQTVICATVLNNNVATLDGNVQIQAAMSATVDRALLHRRFCHISKDRLEQVIREKLSTNLKLTSLHVLISVRPVSWASSTGSPFHSRPLTET